ncbi:HAD family hydrolase [Bacillus sp. 1NLA3E]|uniref:HAD family hydrolase n=1 Tax=Bacillus sp. 1NLA3E TaxID=666686 RepID=UPI000247F195|nr:HAD family hydrolase [Bacillus sp. 1NLA3E]AGK54012.1 HAD family hydrolase [Bacillus sp. 1NLA3E]
MISIVIPGFGDIDIKNLILDFNGTIAKDGFLIKGVVELIKRVVQSVEIYVITADTFGSVANELKDLPVKIIPMETHDERNEKLALVKNLGSKGTVSIGNGGNDEWMLKESLIGICIIGQEGCSTKALHSADLAITDIKNALELFIFTKRLKATLRF